MPRKKNRKDRFPLVIAVLGGLLILGAVIVLALQVRPDITPTPVVADHEEETYPEIQRVTLEEAKTALDQGSAVFVDVRSSSAFAAGHIPGSLSIPINELETRLGELDPEEWIITYCT